jgi:hypothetical protein
MRPISRHNRQQRLEALFRVLEAVGLELGFLVSLDWPSSLQRRRTTLAWRRYRRVVRDIEATVNRPVIHNISTTPK